MTQPQTLIQLSRLRLLLWVGCGLLAGCGFGKQDQAVNSLDLGALPVQVAVSASPPSKAYALAVPSGLSIGVVQTTDVVWRVGENGMPQAYATFRWFHPLQL